MLFSSSSFAANTVDRVTRNGKAMIIPEGKDYTIASADDTEAGAEKTLRKPSRPGKTVCGCGRS